MLQLVQRMHEPSSLQVEPYLRVLAYDLPDPGPPNDELPQLIDRVAALDDVMRSVQLLASKFRCVHSIDNCS